MLFYNTYLNLIMKADSKGEEEKLKNQLCLHLCIIRGFHTQLPSKNLAGWTYMNDGINWRLKSGSYVNLVPHFSGLANYTREKNQIYQDH